MIAARSVLFSEKETPLSVSSTSKEDIISGAAERGVQGVQLHTLKILWVCKTPILHALLPCDLLLNNANFIQRQLGAHLF